MTVRSLGLLSSPGARRIPPIVRPAHRSRRPQPQRGGLRSGAQAPRASSMRAASTCTPVVSSWMSGTSSAQAMNPKATSRR